MAGQNKTQVILATKPKRRSKKRKQSTVGVSVQVKGPHLRNPERHRSTGSGSAAAAYRVALSNPFSQLASGAKVPDLFGYPTTTFRLEATIQLVTNGNGVASGVLLPIPHFPYLNCPGTSTNMTGITVPWNNTAGQYIAGTAWNMNKMSTSLSNFRVVAAGHQISNLLPPLSLTGRLIAATTPIVGPVPSYGYLTTSTTNTLKTDDILSVATGVGLINTHVNTHLPSSMIALPTAVELPLAEIQGQVLAVNHSITGPGAFDFHNTWSYDSATPGMGSFEAEDYGMINITTAVTKLSSHDSMNFVGRDAILLRVEGAPANVPVLEIKTIFHIEGSPYLSLVALPGGFTDSSEPSPVAPMEHLRMLTEISQMPVFKILGREALNQASSYLRRKAGHNGRGTLANLLQGLSVHM